jgi:hypothetical protein
MECFIERIVHYREMLGKIVARHRLMFRDGCKTARTALGW